MTTRRAAILAATLTALPFGGCGSGANNNVVAIVTSNFTPNPVVATASSDPAFTNTASFTLTLTETAGVGVTLTSLTPVIYEASGGVITAVLPASNSRTNVTIPSNRLEASSTLSIGFDVDYTAPNTGRVILVRITLSIIDDKGVSSSGVVDVPVS